MQEALSESSDLPMQKQKAPGFPRALLEVSFEPVSVFRNDESILSQFVCSGKGRLLLRPAGFSGK